MPFRVQAKKHFLTYSQCPLDKLFVFEFLKDLEKDFKYLCVSSELHQDGKSHIHAFIEFYAKRDIKNERHFDIEFDGTTHHPNHKAANKNSSKYTKKDGDFIEEGIEGNHSEWKVALGKRSAEEAFQHILEHHTRDAIIFHGAITNFLDSTFSTETVWEPEFDISSFNPGADLMDWVSNNVMVGKQSI